MSRLKDQKRNRDRKVMGRSYSGLCNKKDEELSRRLEVFNQWLLEIPDAASRIFHIAFVSRYQMDMEMKNRLAGGSSAVHAKIVTIGNVFMFPIFFGAFRNIPKLFPFGFAQAKHVRIVALKNN